MPLGWKADNPAGASSQSTQIKYMHLTKLDRTNPAGSLVILKHLGKRLLELQCDSLAHDTLSVHSIHQGFNGCHKKVAFTKLDHMRNTTYF